MVADKMMVAYHGRRDVEQYVLAIMNIVSASPSLGREPQAPGASLRGLRKAMSTSHPRFSTTETEWRWGEGEKGGLLMARSEQR